VSNPAPTKSVPFGIVLLPDSTLPPGHFFCDGRELPIADHLALFAVLGTTHGGNGVTTFALPDRRKEERDFAGSRYAICVNVHSTVAEQTHNAGQTSVRNDDLKGALAIWHSLSSRVGLAAFNFVPAGFVPCDGTQMEVANYPDLFALLGARFGGDGVRTFATPDLSALREFTATLPIISTEANNDQDVLGVIRNAGGCGNLAAYHRCDGIVLNITANTPLYALLGHAYVVAPLATPPVAAEPSLPWWKKWLGAKPRTTPQTVQSTFALPDLRALEALSGDRYLICISGVFPSRTST
jgi:microcystin-dependent protein